MMNWSMTPEFNWFAIGLLLLGLELFTGTFVVLFFACGAFLTAALTWAGILTDQSAQIFVFTLLSAAGLLVFKDKLRRGWGGKQQTLHGDLGSILVLDQDLPENGNCEVQYQGAVWTAVNETGKPLVRGETVKIGRIDGLKLIIK